MFHIMFMPPRPELDNKIWFEQIENRNRLTTKLCVKFSMMSVVACKMTTSFDLFTLKRYGTALSVSIIIALGHFVCVTVHEMGSFIKSKNIVLTISNVYLISKACHIHHEVASYGWSNGPHNRWMLQQIQVSNIWYILIL